MLTERLRLSNNLLLLIRIELPKLLMMRIELPKLLPRLQNGVTIVTSLKMILITYLLVIKGLGSSI